MKPDVIFIPGFLTWGNPTRWERAYEFKPKCKVWLACNDFPKAPAGDEAMWDRLKPIPFDVKFRGTEGEVKDLAEKLVQEEGSGILNWMLRGLEEYSEIGLAVAEEAKQKAEELREDQDFLGRFLEERTGTTDVNGEMVLVSRLYETFKMHADITGEGRGWSRQKFNAEMRAKGYDDDKGTAKVAAGSAWLWAREEMANSVDVLFVDEASQMSLANVLATSPSATSIVLLGDPQQLDQPQKGVHPPGADVSALGHLLNGRPTIADDQGIFLTETRRLHPDVCAFTSEIFYEGRLVARPENAHQRLNIGNSLGGTGLRFAPVLHSGNQNESPEETDKVAVAIEGLLKSGATWTNKKGERALAPYPLILDLPGAASIVWDKFGTNVAAGRKPCWNQQLRKVW